MRVKRNGSGSKIQLAHEKSGSNRKATKYIAPKIREDWWNFWRD